MPLVLISLLALGPERPASAQSSYEGVVNISFRGPDVIHVSYDVKSTQPNTVRVDLFFQEGAGQRRRIDSGGSQIKGTQRLTGLAAGPHYVSTDIVLRNTPGDEITNGGPSASANLAPDTYSGTLLYSESCAGGTLPGKITMTVPIGLSLTLENFVKGTTASVNGSGAVTIKDSHLRSRLCRPTASRWSRRPIWKRN